MICLTNLCMTCLVQDSLGFHEGDDEEEKEEKAAGKKAADDEEAMSLKLSAEEQKDARMQRAAKRGLKPSQDEGYDHLETRWYSNTHMDYASTEARTHN